MAVERTLTIIKPDSMEKKNEDSVLSILKKEGFEIVAERRTRLTEEQARAFYIEHAEKPFYNSLVAYMTSGPVILAVLQKDNAIEDLRTVMGATDPKKAAEGTIRKKYGESIERNAIHGSANRADAEREVLFFFPEAGLA